MQTIVIGRRRGVVAILCALGSIGALGSGGHAMAQAASLDVEAEPWKVDVVYENDTRFRGKDNTGHRVGLSKFRNTVQVEADKKVGDGWALHGVLRGTWDGVYRMNKDEYGREAGSKTAADAQIFKVNVRVVAATNVDLQAAVKAGRFRSDLFYRLNVYPIAIPPLRERALDIPPLVDAMIAKFGTLHGKRGIGITDKAQKALKRYHWPGNVRELENMIERGVILAPAGGDIELDHLFPSLEYASGDESGLTENGRIEEKRPDEENLLCEAFMATGMPLDEIESMLLRNAVARANGNLAAAARLLGLTRPQLTYRLKRDESTLPPSQEIRHADDQ